MHRWPWITIALGVLIAISPPGQELLDGALLSNEQLTRNIARPLLEIGLLILVAIGTLEVAVRWLWRRRRAKRAGPPLD